MSENQQTQSIPVVGRNEPCPCGSGKKYKKCHGFETPVITAPAPSAEPGADLPFDPSKIDPEFLKQVNQTLSQLPKGQMQRLQALMQKAMAGKDISKEAAEFERTLPPNLQNLMNSSQMPDLQDLEKTTDGSTPEEGKKASKWGRFWKSISGKSS